MEADQRSRAHAHGTVRSVQAKHSTQSHKHWHQHRPTSIKPSRRVHLHTVRPLSIASPPAPPGPSLTRLCPSASPSSSPRSSVQPVALAHTLSLSRPARFPLTSTRVSQAPHTSRARPYAYHRHLSLLTPHSHTDRAHAPRIRQSHLLRSPLSALRSALAPLSPARGAGCPSSRRQTRPRRY